VSKHAELDRLASQLEARVFAGVVDPAETRQEEIVEVEA